VLTDLVPRPTIRLPSAVTRTWKSIIAHLPPRNFITLHYAYFVAVCMLSSIIFWGASTPPRSVSYTDSLFLVVSAMTLAGLNTVNLSILNTFQQVLLFILIILGSAILVSIAVVHVRKKAFERRFKDIVEVERQKRRDRSSFSRRTSFSRSITWARPEVDGVVARGRAIVSEKPSTESLHQAAVDTAKATAPGAGLSPSLSQQVPPQGDRDGQEEGVAASKAIPAGRSMTIDTGLARRITFAPSNTPRGERGSGRLLSMQGIGARQSLLNHPMQSPVPIYPSGQRKSQEITQSPLPVTPAHHGLSEGIIGRNSQFSSLSLAERERIGGVEYRAVTFLSVIVPLYFILWQLLGCIGLGGYLATKRPDATKVNGENPWHV